MSGPNKVYVIDPVDPAVKGKISSSSEEEFRELPEYLQSSGDNRKTSSGSGASSRRGDEKKSGVPLILSYLVGPLSILATRRGRKSRFWTYLSVFSVALSTIIIWMWRGLSYWSTPENSIGAVMLLAAVISVVAGFSAWTRAIVLMGRYEGPRIRRSPDWIRDSWAAGIFGVVSPGMGLFLAGRHKQAAAVLWMACLTLVSMLVLSRAMWLWEFNAHAGAFAIMPDTLEYLLMVLGAAAVLGGLAWIVQALNGARLAGRASNRKAVSRSNWAAVALVISLIAYSFMSRPADFAGALDRASTRASSEGMKIIPLYLSNAAIRLDPSRPDYFISAIGLYKDNGDHDKAIAMRQRLVDRLKPSLSLLEEEGLVAVKAESGRIIPAAPDIEEPVMPASASIPAELLILDWDIPEVRP